MCRSPFALRRQTALVKADDLFRAALVVVWQSRAPLTDGSEFFRQAGRKAVPRLTFQLLPERIHDGIGNRLAGARGQRAGQLVGLSVPDVQSHLQNLPKDVLFP
jgi:hypothetical protein